MTSTPVTRFLATVAPPVLFSVLVALVWHGAVTLFDLKPYLLPGPVEVAHAVSTHLGALLGAAALRQTVHAKGEYDWGLATNHGGDWKSFDWFGPYWVSNGTKWIYYFPWTTE